MGSSDSGRAFFILYSITMLTSRIYSAQEHQVWSIIFKQLSELIAKSGMVHSIISDTFASIPFDPYHIPEPHAFSKALTKGS